MFDSVVLNLWALPKELMFLPDHSAVDLKSKETFSCCAILVGCIKISTHPVAD